MSSLRPADPAGRGNRIQRLHRVDGQLRTALAALDAGDFTRPSLLPDWSVGHVVSHLARNAEGLANLLHWARTGVETPMYRSTEARDADVAVGAARQGPEILADLITRSDALFADIAALPEQSWAALVRTRSGGPVPAERVLDHRLCELLLHHHDLGIDAGLAGYPVDDAAALLAALQHTYVRTHDVAPIRLLPTDAEPLLIGAAGTGIPTSVTGPAFALAGWLTGRTTGDELTFDGPRPTLPSW